MHGGLSTVSSVRGFRSFVESLAKRPAAAIQRREFTPPPRFADRLFSNYLPQHETQAKAAERLRAIATDLTEVGGNPRTSWWPPSLLRAGRRSRRHSGVYLDGGFGVGKTHLLVALWHASPGPKAYLSFDELMYFLGLAGISTAIAGFASYRLIAIDEWELDDPGNLKLALAFLRGVIRDGAFVSVTSNTLPHQLGAGRFSRKDFRLEIEELAAGFEVVTVEGQDYRQRHFEAVPGRRYFLDPVAYEERLRAAPGLAARGDFTDMLATLAEVHPIRYREIAGGLDGLFIQRVTPIARLPDALRWVHFIDSIYDAGTRLAATGDLALGELFPAGDLSGPYGKKLSRCLSRMEELLGAEG